MGGPMDLNFEMMEEGKESAHRLIRQGCCLKCSNYKPGQPCCEPAEPGDCAFFD